MLQPRLPKYMERMKVVTDPKNGRVSLRSLDDKERFILPPMAMLKVRICGQSNEGYPFTNPTLAIYDTQIPEKTILEDHMEKRIIFIDSQEEIKFEFLPPGTQLVLMPKNWL